MTVFTCVPRIIERRGTVQKSAAFASTSIRRALSVRRKKRRSCVFLNRSVQSRPTRFTCIILAWRIWLDHIFQFLFMQITL